jgi:hypothetical protein
MTRIWILHRPRKVQDPLKGRPVVYPSARDFIELSDTTPYTRLSLYLREMIPVNRSLVWLIPGALILGLTGIVLSVIGSSPSGIVMGIVVIAAGAFLWFRNRQPSR